MGLDMYLVGKKYYGGHWGSTRQEDGLPVEKVELSLGYWRKHHSLHNFIVREFAAGDDNCEPIDLMIENINEIIDVIEQDKLDVNEGWSSEEHFRQKEEDLAILGKALAWFSFDQDPPNCKPSWKTIYYVGSW